MSEPKTVRVEIHKDDGTVTVFDGEALILWEIAHRTWWENGGRQDKHLMRAWIMSRAERRVKPA